MPENALLTLYRAKVRMLLEQFAQRRRVYVAENGVKGLSVEAMAGQKGRDLSRWNMERDALAKALKKEAAGLVNSAFQQAYKAGLGMGQSKTDMAEAE